MAQRDTNQNQAKITRFFFPNQNDFHVKEIPMAVLFPISRVISHYSQSQRENQLKPKQKHLRDFFRQSYSKHVGK